MASTCGGERGGGSDKPSPGWLLKGDGSSAAPGGRLTSEPHWQELGQTAGFTAWPRANQGPVDSR